VGAPEEEARLARRFLPVGSQWIPEERIPKEPQEKPRMVIWELSSFVGRAPSEAQEKAAERLYRESLAAAHARGWFDFQAGMKDGYKLLHGDKRHYFNEEYLYDDRLLDPERPEFLMYFGPPEGHKLAGRLVSVRHPRERGPQIGGAKTAWHYHVWSEGMCLVKGLLSVGPVPPTGSCARGTATHRSPEMLHVWFLDHPGGRFATSMWLKPAQLEALMERDRKSRGAR